MEESLRVMTFNLWNYNPPWELRRKLVAETIRSHNPDVVALQESRHDFRHDGGRGQGEQIAELTGYHPTSAVAQVYIPVLRVDEGLTILTREQPAGYDVCRLAQHPHDREDENRRICLAVSIEHAGRRVHIFDTHFSLSASARLDNALEVQRFVRERAGDEPGVLMGDLNAEPDEDSMLFLTGARRSNGEEGGFVDCWTAANPSDPGYTYASFDPVRRIDYILGWNLPEGPISALVDPGRDEQGVFPSDHSSVVAALPL
jgi:endonuclease/exonuclease/phosphatase family metal-dependent hydrolase